MLVTIFSQLQSYSVPAWSAFILITLVASSIGATRGLIIGHCLIAVLVLVLDFRWVQAEMASPTYNPNTGPDFDGVFLLVFPIGVLIRVLLINSSLLPLGAFCVWLSRRRARRPVA